MRKKTLLATICLIILLTSADSRAEFIMGNTSGVFENPSPPNAVFSGVGTDTFVYGDDAFGLGRSQLAFEGAGIDSAANMDFALGTLTYFNGSTLAGSSPSTVDLGLDFVLTSPLSTVIPITIQFELLTTANEGEPDPDADFVRISSPLVPAFEIGGVSYIFELIGFGNVGGAGSLPATDTLRLAELETATADLIGRISTVAIPEPSSILMLATGALALPVIRGWTGRRPRRQGGEAARGG